VALLRADWTRRDPAITQALAALGRNGVPVYVLLAPGQPRWC
jgi:thiol:disulfide interchange protein DsbD